MSTNSEWMGTHSPLELKRVDKVQMGVMSPDFLAKLSVVKVTTAELYQANGVPKPNGLLDSRMGTLDPRVTCGTCCAVRWEELHVHLQRQRAHHRCCPCYRFHRPARSR